MFLIHHLLEHCGGVNTRHIVVFESRHERNCTRCHNKLLSINVGQFAADDVLYCQTAAFEDVPNGIVEQYAFVVFAGKGFGDVEATHATIFLLAFKEEELVGLHIELSADAGVVVDNDIVDAESVELFAASKSGRTGTHDGNGGFVYFMLDISVLRLKFGHCLVGVEHGDVFNAIDGGYADTAHFAVDKHLAGTAFADTALQRAVAALQRMAVYGESRFVQRFGNGVALARLYFLSIVKKFGYLALRDVQNRVILNLIHTY